MFVKATEKWRGLAVTLLYNIETHPLNRQILLFFCFYLLKSIILFTRNGGRGGGGGGSSSQRSRLKPMGAMTLLYSMGCNKILWIFQGWSFVFSGISKGKVTNLKIPWFFSQKNMSLPALAWFLLEEPI